MNIISQIDEMRGLRRHTVAGLISVPELQAWLVKFYENPEHDADMDVLWDLREADFSSVRTLEIESFVGMVNRHWGTGGGSKAALIVSGDLDFGLSRMYEILMSGVTSSSVMVFRDPEEAEGWLAG